MTRTIWIWVAVSFGALVLLLLVGSWFVFGPKEPARSPRSDRSGAAVVSVDPRAYFESARRHALLDRLLGGFRPEVPATQQEALERLYLLHVLAMRDGISIPDERLAQTLKTMPVFTDPQTGEFDPGRFKEVVRIAGFDRVADFERVVRERLAVQAFLERVGGIPGSSEEEIRAAWHRLEVELGLEDLRRELRSRVNSAPESGIERDS